MARDIDSGIITELDSKRVRTAYLFEITLTDPVTGAPESLYATNNVYDIIYEQNIYTAAGFLLNIEGIEEFTDSRISNVTVSLAGVAENLIGTLLAYDYLDKPLCIKRVFLDDTQHIGEDSDFLDATEDSVQIIGEPITIFEGGTESPTITESQTKGYVVVTLQATSRFAEFQTRNGRHTNPAEQKFYDSSDRIFEQVGKIDPNLVWGKED